MFKNSKGVRISGVLQRGTKNKAIIMCHGFRSNRSSRGRFDRFANTFQQSGYYVFRFDFGGCGESEDRPITLAGEVDDLTSAIDYIVCSGFSDIALYGHSLGARVCLEAYPSRAQHIKTLVLTGAGTGPVHYDWSLEFNESQLTELSDTGFLTQPVDDPYRTNVKIAKQMLVDFEQVEQQWLLSNITCPTLIVHGDQGEEKILLPLTEKGMKWLPVQSSLEVIQGAAHSFMDHLDDVERITSEWLIKHF